MSKPLLSLLMPYRADTQHRARLYGHNTALWHDLPVELCIASDGAETGPFNIARAINRGRRLATTDRLLIHGVDHVPTNRNHLAHLARTLETWPWMGAFAATERLDQKSTLRVLAGADPWDGSMRLTGRVGFCFGVIAMRAMVFDSMGGYDERFEGWGHEDFSMRLALRTLYGTPPTPIGTLRSHWHPPASREREQGNIALAKRYRGVAGDPVAMRDLLAESRQAAECV